MEDDDVAVVDEEGPGSSEITKLQVGEGVIIKFILSRRLSVNRGDLQDVRDATAGGAVADEWLPRIATGGPGGKLAAYGPCTPARPGEPR